MPTLDDAARLAAAGLHILPIARDSKRPLGGYGLTHATDDPDTIAEWWALWPDANVAIACEASGLVVLDIDPRNGGFLENLPDDIPLDCVVVTGSGGWHVYLKAREGASYPGHLGEGIDVKWRGYVLAPPSIHPDTGKPYRYEHKGRPPLAPTTLEARAGDGITARAAQLVGSGAPIPRGQQNDVLYGFARKLWRDVGLRHLVVAALWGVVQAQCVDQDKSDPWTLEDCEAIADRAVEKVDPLDVKLAAADYTVADDDVPQAKPKPADGDLELDSLVGMVPLIAVPYGGRLRIPLGTLSILTGQQGVGKGLLMVSEAAVMSKAGYGVLIASDEDSVQHTILPRLIAAGADLERIHMVRSLQLPEHSAALARRAKADNVRLVIVDPWTNHLGDANVDKAQDVRPALMALKQAAEAGKFSVLLIAHPNKNSNVADPLERIAHSSALSQVARSAFWIVRDPRPQPAGLFDDKRERKLVAQVKQNLTQRMDTYLAVVDTTMINDQHKAYTDSVPILVEVAECDTDMDWLAIYQLQQDAYKARREQAKPTKTNDAREWLTEYLDQSSGPQQWATILAAAAPTFGDDDAAEQLLKRARRKLVSEGVIHSPHHGYWAAL